MKGTGVLHAIDFGTSTSAIVVGRPDGTIARIRDPLRAGSTSIPTSVCVLDGGEIVVGTKAENAKHVYPIAYRREFKQDFGDATPSRPGGRPLTADDMATEVIRFLRAQALAAVRGTPERVVVTIPASWEAGNRRLMRDVVSRAGYGEAEIDLVPEPVAAIAHAFAEHTLLSGRLTVLIFDLGGGTFDCAVAQGAAGWFEVLGAPDGVDGIGGAAFDKKILGLVRRHHGAALPPALDGRTDDPDVRRRWETLRDTCEAIKIRLSVEDPVHERLGQLAAPQDFSVTQAQFAAEIRPLVAEALRVCDRILRQRLNMDWTDIDRVVPVGGSSHIPVVKEMLSERGRPVLEVDSPDMAVVLGAAIIGRVRHSGTGPRRLFVNGERKIVDRPAVGFDEVLMLALGQPSTGPFVTFTVTFTHGPHHRPAGSLLAGESVPVADDMVFNVTVTDRS
jgi:molecular chaperone DnaK